MNNAFSKFDLSGKTALVTGGATGMGYYMARGLMRSGAKVILAARRESVLQSAVARLRSESTSGEATYHSVDLADRESIVQLVNHANSVMGGVDIFIGNAALDVFEPVDAIRDETIDQMFQVNVSSNIELVRAFLPGMRARKWGRILFSSSISTLCAGATENLNVYAATKGALNAFARAVAAETGHYGVTVNSLVLGSFLTEMLEASLERIEASDGKAAAKGFLDSVASMTALGRWGRASEVEGLVQFVASDAASYLTGSNLVYDGGMSMMLRPHSPPDAPLYPENH